MSNNLSSIPGLAALACAALAVSSRSAQDAYHEPEHPAAAPEDVASIEAIVTATYDVISGPAGERDWNRFESLFYPELGRLMPCGSGPEGAVVQNMTPRDYQARAGGFFARSGFFETELARRIDRFGHMAQVFSTYEAREAPEAEPSQRGINGFQLFHDGERWWILSILWDVESPDQPIPEPYLRQK